MIRKIVLLTLVLIMATSCSGEVELENHYSSNTEIINGTPIAHSEVPSIVALTDTESGRSFCTGTLIAPDLVLTAAHCIKNTLSNPGTLQVTYGHDEPAHAPDTSRHSVFSLSVHPQYNEYVGPGLPWNDVGLVLLQEPIEDAVVAPVLEIYEADSNVVPGRAVIIAGYGRTDVNTNESGLLTAGITLIMKRSGFEMQLGAEKDEANACHGDSGGPAYIQVDNVRYVTGITSRAYAAPYCETGAIYTIVAPYQRWIELEYSKLKEARAAQPEDPKEQDAGADAKGGVSSTPPTTTDPAGCGCSVVGPRGQTDLGIFIIGLGLLFVRRRKINN